MAHGVGRERGATLEEIEAVYRHDYGRFVRAAAMIVGDAETAADAVQEAFALAVRSRARFRGGSTLSTWLWRIVVNSARGAARSRRRRLSLVGGLVDDLPADVSSDGVPADAGAERGELLVVIARLPERQRLALFLRYYADLDYRTIASILAVRPGTVASSLAAAHATLRDLLEGSQGERVRG